MNIMNHIYVVTGMSGEHEYKSEENLYVGTNEDIAHGFMPNDEGHTHTLSLEVWSNGILIKGYGKYIGDDGWTLNFDKTEELQIQVDYFKRKLKEAEDELLNLSYDLK